MGRMLHLVQRGGAWAGCGPAHPLLAVPNVTAHPSTASIPTSNQIIRRGTIVPPVLIKGFTWMLETTV